MHTLIKLPLTQADRTEPQHCPNIPKPKNPADVFTPPNRLSHPYRLAFETRRLRRAEVARFLRKEVVLTCRRAIERRAWPCLYCWEAQAVEGQGPMYELSSSENRLPVYNRQL